MLKGEPWSCSWQKRLMDVSAGVALAPVATAVEIAARASFGENARQYPTMLASERVGISPPSGKLATFVLYKIRTGQTEMAPAFNAIAQMIRDTAIDETGQYINLLEGTISLRGHRPIVKSELEKAYDEAGSGRLVDQHRSIVLPKKPGIVSSFSIASHLQEPGARLELDIKDEIDGSFTYDTALIIQYAEGCLRKAIQSRTT